MHICTHACRHVNNPFPSIVLSSTPLDRDQLEEEIDTFVSECMAKIESLKQTINKDKKRAEQHKQSKAQAKVQSGGEEDKGEDEDEDEHDSRTRNLIHQCEPQVLQHKHTVIIHLFHCLEQVTATLQEMKKVRMQQLREATERLRPAEFRMDSSGGSGSGGGGGAAGSNLHSGGFNAQWLVGSGSISDDDDSDDDEGGGLETMLTQEEEQVFQEENQDLLEELQDNLDQIRQAEQKLVEISKLMSLFSTKVMEQEEQIDAIYDTNIESVSHVQMGNESLRTAIERSKSGQLHTFLFFIGAGLSLLFLDWQM